MRKDCLNHNMVFFLFRFPPLLHGSVSKLSRITSALLFHRCGKYTSLDMSKGKSRHFLRLGEAVVSLKLAYSPFWILSSYLPENTSSILLFFLPAQSKKCWSCDCCLPSLFFLLFFQKVIWRKEQENQLSSNPSFLRL